MPVSALFARESGPPSWAFATIRNKEHAIVAAVCLVRVQALQAVGARTLITLDHETISVDAPIDLVIRAMNEAAGDARNGR